MNYIATDTQLTAIADAIRAKGKVSESSSYGHVGKNMLNPETGKTPELPKGSYTFSGTLLRDLSGQGLIFQYYYGTQPVGVLIKGEAGERISFSIPVIAEGVVIRFEPMSFTGLLSDCQFEAGTSATDYEPYQILLDFPDDFIAAIEDI